MLLAIQFTFADSRKFVEQDIGLLERPNWPSASPDSDFVRSFGEIKKRQNGGISGWIGENIVCEAKRAIRFPISPSISTVLLGIPVYIKIAYRRFYFDGLAAGKFEIGLGIHIASSTKVLSKQQSSSLLKHCLKLPVLIPRLTSTISKSTTYSSNFISCEIGEAGKHLAKLYALESISRAQLPTTAEWWVRAAAPVICLIAEARDPKLCFPFSQEITTGSNEFLRQVFSEDIKVRSHDTSYKKKKIRVWEILRGADDKYRDLRTLKIYLLRLHTERACLRIILENIATKKLVVSPFSQCSNSLQHYLNKSIKNVSRASNLLEIDIAELVRSFEDIVSPGERDELLATLENLDARLNIRRKVERYINNQIHITTGGITMGDTYNINGQAGAVGSNAQAHGNTFVQNQLSQSIDLSQLAKELKELRQAIKKNQDSSPQVNLALDDISKAQIAITKKNAPELIEHLKSAGQWTLDVAKEIGKDVVVEAIKQSMGMQ